MPTLVFFTFLCTATINESKEKFWIGPNGFAYDVAKEELVAKEFIRAVNRVIQNTERTSSVKNLLKERSAIDGSFEMFKGAL
jgi:hypothetical protein